MRAPFFQNLDRKELDAFCDKLLEKYELGSDEYMDELQKYKEKRFETQKFLNKHHGKDGLF